MRPFDECSLSDVTWRESTLKYHTSTGVFQICWDWKKVIPADIVTSQLISAHIAVRYIIRRRWPISIIIFYSSHFTNSPSSGSINSTAVSPPIFVFRITSHSVGQCNVRSSTWKPLLYAFCWSEYREHSLNQFLSPLRMAPLLTDQNIQWDHPVNSKPASKS